jgi:hypothetical protein
MICHACELPVSHCICADLTTLFADLDWPTLDDDPDDFAYWAATLDAPLSGHLIA